jgi:hypothetical protein
VGDFGTNEKWILSCKGMNEAEPTQNMAFTGTDLWVAYQQYCI